MIANTPAAWDERASLPLSHEAAMWSQSGQTERFGAVLAALEPRPGETLLDYGCGTGALCELLQDDVRYVGYDWSDAMITRACKEHHRSGRIFTTSILGFDDVDLVACIGTFNLRHNWSKDKTWRTLVLLWDDTIRALAASLYSGSDPDCLAYGFRETVEFAKKISGPATFDVHQWRHNDLMLTLERP